VRRSHVATATIQELLVRGLGTGAAGDGGGAPAPVPDAGGPRLERDSVAVTPRTVTLHADKPLAPDSVNPETFSVTAFTDTGWNTLEIREARLDVAGTTVTLRLRETVTGDFVRIIARGTGPTPVLGVDFVPLAGAPGSPPGTGHDGHDFVHMVDRRT
jgi:hypothetical protein